MNGVGSVRRAAPVLAVLVAGGLFGSPAVSAQPPPMTPSTTATAAPIPHRFQLGVGAHGGLVDGGAGIDGFFVWGLTLGVVVVPHLTLGITRLGFGIGYSSIEGTIWQIDFTPYVEGSFRVGEVVEPFGRLGVSMQAVGDTNVRPGFFGASVFLSLGSRFWPIDWLSLEVELAGYAPMTDPARFGSTSVSPFTVAGTLGGGVGFHF